jgi:hypothetical protein
MWKSNNFVPVASGIQHALRMRHITICGLFGCTIFFHLISITALFSKKKVIECGMCVLIFSTNLSEIFFILRRIGRDMVINVYCSSCKIPVMVAGF